MTSHGLHTASHQPTRAAPATGSLPSWARAFPGTTWQGAAARRFVAGLLHGSPLRDDAVAVLAELYANAVLHTASGRPGGLVIVQVTRWRDGVRVAVTDQGSPHQPVIRPPDPAGEPAENGHGLHLAAALAGHLAWHDEGHGRTIAAIIGNPPPAHHLPTVASRLMEPARPLQPA